MVKPKAIQYIIYIFIFEMLLAIDIGNTDIVFAINQNDHWLLSYRERSTDKKLPGAYALSMKNYFLEKDVNTEAIEHIIISSVVPSITPVIEQMCGLLFTAKPQVMGDYLYDRLNIKTNNPREIGTDLIANAVAAFDQFRDDCIVIDFGTALTFTTINSSGDILGVAIAPGLKTAMKSLSGNTAQLPEIQLALPDSVLGKNTIHAMQSGILFGYIGLVEKIIERIELEIGNPCKKIATGGLSAVLTPLHDQFDVINKNLTLDGLKIISTLINDKNIKNK